MKTLDSLLICLCIFFLVTCTKEEKENRDFDSIKSTASIVKINTSEIGGNGLKLISSRDNDSPISKSSFNTVVSKEGIQLLLITDASNKLRGLTLSTPTTEGADIMEINSLSTSILLIFLTPGILNTDPQLGIETIQKIQNLTTFTSFKAYIKNHLVSNSINEIIQNATYSSLLTACIEEYFQDSTNSKNDLFKGLFESKNYFTINRLAVNKLEFENTAFRFVTIGERDIDSKNTELRVSSIIQSMGGGIPLSYGSLFQQSVWKPTVETVDFNPPTNTFCSEFWVVGPGLKSSTETIPISIQKIEAPWIETIIMYGVFPLLDCFDGSLKLFKESSKLKESTSFTKFQKVITDAKKSASLTKLFSVENNIEAFNRELINVIVLLGQSVATQVAAQYGVPGVGQFFALVSAFIAAANLGPFIATLVTTEPYCKFVLMPNVFSFEESFNSFTNWKPASDNGLNCSWTAINGWAKIATMGNNPSGWIQAVYEKDLPFQVLPNIDFVLKTFIRVMDGDPSGSCSGVGVNLIGSDGSLVCRVNFNDSQAASGYGGLQFSTGLGMVYTNDPNGFSRNNPTLNGLLEIRRSAKTWSAFLNGQQLGTSKVFDIQTSATKVQISNNRYRNYGYRNGEIDYIQIYFGK